MIQQVEKHEWIGEFIRLSAEAANEFSYKSQAFIGVAKIPFGSFGPQLTVNEEDFQLFLDNELSLHPLKFPRFTSANDTSLWSLVASKISDTINHETDYLVAGFWCLDGKSIAYSAANLAEIEHEGDIAKTAKRHVGEAKISIEYHQRENSGL